MAKPLLSSLLLALLSCTLVTGCARKRCKTRRYGPWAFAEALAPALNGALGESSRLCRVEQLHRPRPFDHHPVTHAAKFEIDAQSYDEMVKLVDRTMALLQKRGLRQDKQRTHRDRLVGAPARPAEPYARSSAQNRSQLRYLMAADNRSVIAVMGTFVRGKNPFAVLELQRLAGPANIVEQPVAGRKRLARFAKALSQATSQGSAPTPAKDCPSKPQLLLFRKAKSIAWRLARPLVLDAPGALGVNAKFEGQKVMSIGEFNDINAALAGIDGGYFALYRRIKTFVRKGFRAVSSRSLGPNMRLVSGQKTKQTYEVGEVRVARADSGEVVYLGKLTFHRAHDWNDLQRLLRAKLHCEALEVRVWDHKTARLARSW